MLAEPHSARGSNEYLRKNLNTANFGQSKHTKERFRTNQEPSLSPVDCLAEDRERLRPQYEFKRITNLSL